MIVSQDKCSHEIILALTLLKLVLDKSLISNIKKNCCIINFSKVFQLKIKKYIYFLKFWFEI